VTGVRYREDTGFQGRCDYCLEWWPLDGEFWQISKRSFRMCLACVRDYSRLKQAERRQDPERRARDREGVALQRKALMQAGIMGEYRNRWYRENAERIRASRREKYAAKRAAEGKPYKPRGSSESVVLATLRKKAA
jgi:hypothetical protein